MDGKGRMVHKASNQLLALVQRGGGRVEMRSFREADREVLLIDVLLTPSTPLPFQIIINFQSVSRSHSQIFTESKIIGHKKWPKCMFLAGLSSAKILVWGRSLQGPNLFDSK